MIDGGTIFEAPAFQYYQWGMAKDRLMECWLNVLSSFGEQWPWGGCVFIKNMYIAGLLVTQENWFYYLARTNNYV